jgi:hypothetical protein
MQELGVEPLYYYMGEEHNRVSVCLLMRKDKAVARGVSICSPMDIFEKRLGRIRATGRAIQALVNKVTTDEIVGCRFDYGYPGLWDAEGDFGFKSAFDPILTEREEGIVNGYNESKKRQLAKSKC